MCKLYQIEYTCRHLAKVETSPCRFPPPSVCIHGIQLLPQRAPHKCPTCRTYDRDRWRRGWPPISLPPPPKVCIQQFKMVSDEPSDSEDDDYAIVFEEGMFLGRVEHCEEAGGVGVGLGLGLGGENGQKMMLSGGLNSEHAGNSEGFGMGIDGTGGDNSTFPNSTSTSPAKPDRGLESKKRAESFAAGDGEIVGCELRSRFGGYGGKKVRVRRSSTIEATGGVPMERTFSNRGSLSLKSPTKSSYRGADMEGGGGSGGLGLALGSVFDGGVEMVSGGEEQKETEGGGSGLGLGIGLGFGGIAMEREGGKTTVESGSPKRYGSTRRSLNFTKFPSIRSESTEVGGTSDDTQESVTAQFLDF